MLLSNLKFGSFLTYSPHGIDSTALESKRLPVLIKNDRIVIDLHNSPMPMSRYMAKRLSQEIVGTGLKDLFGQDAALVPAPGSSRTVAAGLRVTLRIASALIEEGIGQEVADILERTEAVAKSAYCRNPSDRPKPIDHYRTISVTQLTLSSSSRIIIVDDFITRGATLLAAASRIADSYPGLEIVAFAMVRTISNPLEFRQITDPCVGKILLRGQDSFREP